MIRRSGSARRTYFPATWARFRGGTFRARFLQLVATTWLRFGRDLRPNLCVSPIRNRLRRGPENRPMTAMNLWVWLPVMFLVGVALKAWFALALPEGVGRHQEKVRSD